MHSKTIYCNCKTGNRVLKILQPATWFMTSVIRHSHLDGKYTFRVTQRVMEPEQYFLKPLVIYCFHILTVYPYTWLFALLNIHFKRQFVNLSKEQNVLAVAKWKANIWPLGLALLNIALHFLESGFAKGMRKEYGWSCLTIVWSSYALSSFLLHEMLCSMHQVSWGMPFSYFGLPIPNQLEVRVSPIIFTLKQCFPNL